MTERFFGPQHPAAICNRHHGRLWLQVRKEERVRVVLSMSQVVPSWLTVNCYPRSSGNGHTLQPAQPATLEMTGVTSPTSAIHSPGYRLGGGGAGETVASSPPGSGGAPTQPQPNTTDPSEREKRLQAIKQREVRCRLMPTWYEEQSLTAASLAQDKLAGKQVKPRAFSVKE